MERTETGMQPILDQLEQLVSGERDAVSAPQLEAYAAFYTAFMTWVKYELKWYGVRSLEEYEEMNNVLLAPLVIGAPEGDIQIKDDELPTYRWSLLTRLTQGLRSRVSPGMWYSVIDTLVTQVVNIYPEITPSIEDSVVYTEDVACYVNPDRIKTVLKSNAHITTMILLSLLPHSALFLRVDKGEK